MSLSNPKTAVTEERLAEFYQQILPYLGGMPDLLANKFSRADLYSTDEKMIGRWTDGKPLYQKTFDNISLSAGTNTFFHNISNLGIVVNVKAIANDTNGGGRPLPWAFANNTASDNKWFAGISVSDTSVNIEIGQFFATAVSTARVTLQYTKSTDSAVEIGDDTDYSTTEKIVGTWIDGKPIYQKTIDFGAMPNATKKGVDHNISNLDKCISINGFEMYSSEGTFMPIPDGNPNSLNSSDGQTGTYVYQGKVWVQSKMDKSAAVAYITLRYTKTTD